MMQHFFIRLFSRQLPFQPDKLTHIFVCTNSASTDTMFHDCHRFTPISQAMPCSGDVLSGTALFVQNADLIAVLNHHSCLLSSSFTVLKQKLVMRPWVDIILPDCFGVIIVDS